MKPIVIRRRPAVTRSDWPVDLHPLVARVYAARGVPSAEAGALRLSDMLAPAILGGIDAACELLVDAIAHDRRICIVGDFDADGATGTAVAVRGLRLLGARDVCYRVPNRMLDGYGLGVGLVDALGDIRPELVMTVDNGIASHAGVAAARARGMRVIVTDHHVPGPTLPCADAIVNPLLPSESGPRSGGDTVHGPLANLAGVGVVFYLLLALRAKLFTADARPDLASLLDLVALGTVADLVPLDANNRILVAAGLNRIRAGRASTGVAALYRAAGRDPTRAVAADLGYALGPRINAAGRLEDMSLGIECLLTDDSVIAEGLADRLSAINAERRELQATMVEQGEAMLARFVERYRDDALPCGIVLHDADWHPGVVGLVASKLKERLNRPVVAFACADESGRELRGSARSIAGFHLRDALADVDAAHPGLIGRFGGHAMAAGLSLPAANLAAFAAAFDATARRRLDPAQLERCLWSDGELDAHEFTPDNARALRYAAPWGQAFPEPAFDNVFAVESWRAVGEKHLRMQLRPDMGGDVFEAILFDALDHMPPPARVRALFQLDLNDWNGRERLQLLVRHIEPA